ncbi:TetR family transcriptional regulator [Nocardia sp. NBC_00881]|uniref:TetR family transcriptional regulator n=1 Tax=Nocardia sp. NBC_00881 TaxID=2975995 RepID=UPI00386379A5|nr:TetR family transcriptional regulator [Nocardia sp. NBC_00881]
MSAVIPDELSLRDRKKLRTRQALIDTALDRFTEQGFEATTLDELCAAVEISKRTFFRYFTSKEDVAMAPTQDLWAAFLTELENSVLGLDQPLIDLLHDTLRTALERMPTDGWADRALRSRRLAARVPSMNAHGLEFCDRTTRAALSTLGEVFELDPHDLRPRLALDITIAAFHCALEEWTLRPEPADRDALASCLREAYAAACASTALTMTRRARP